MLDDFYRKPLVFVVGALPGGVASAIVVAGILHFLFGIQQMANPVAQSFALVALPGAYASGAYYVRFHDSHGWGLAWAWSCMQRPLVEAKQRAWFLVGVAGAVVVVATAALSELRLDWFVDEIVFHPQFRASSSRFLTEVFFWGGFAALLVGATFSYGYQHTIAKVVRWLKEGSPRKD